MEYREVDFGFSTADAEDVELIFGGGNLRLTFRDWKEQRVECAFTDILGFRWDNELDDGLLRDDVCYEVFESKWLMSQAALNGIADASEYKHYKLCFNACGVLEVLCRGRKA